MTTASIALVRRLDATIASVFAACTDPAKLARWLAPGAGRVREIALDLRIGGGYRLDGVDPDGTAYVIHGHYLEIESQLRIVMSWVYEGAMAALRGEASKVTIELRELGVDVTEISLTHEKLTGQPAVDLYRTIWKLCLDRFEAALDPAASDQDLNFPGGMLSDLFGDQHRAIQSDFNSQGLANRVRNAVVSTEMGEDHRTFIESRDFFFLATVDHRGYPTCSHKGGNAGFVRVIDEKTLVFPSFDGNGMFLSMGNLSANPKIGLLFIDFETPQRVRAHGLASVRLDDPLISEFPGAELLVRVSISEIFVNCPRYIHRYERVELSKYVPQRGHAAPIPQWKHIDAMQDVLSEHDRAALRAEGGPLITPEEYLEKLKIGQA